MERKRVKCKQVKLIVTTRQMFSTLSIVATEIGTNIKRCHLQVFSAYFAPVTSIFARFTSFFAVTVLLALNTIATENVQSFVMISYFGESSRIIKN